MPAGAEQGRVGREFLRHYEARLRRLVGSLSPGLARAGDAALFEDLCQEARLLLLGAWERLEPLPGAERLRYADRCVRTLAWRVLAREGRAADRSARIGSDAEWIALVPACDLCAGEADPLAGSLWEAVGDERLVRVLLNLPRADRRLLGLTYLAELEDPEIAQIYHTTPGNIRQKRSRILRRIRKELEKQGAP